MSRSPAAGHVRPLLALAVFVCVFHAPYLASGTTQWDGLEVHYTAQRYFSDAIRAGHLPFWTPYIFSGFPFLSDLQVGAWYPLNWPFFLVGIEPNSINAELLLHSLIACVGAYALTVHLIGVRAPAVAAGLFYGLSGFFAAHSQHLGIVQTAAWLPWLVLALDVIGERLTLARLALAGVLGALLALPGHFQAALYAFSGAALWAALDSVVVRRRARAVRLALGLLAVGVWGALLSAVMILPGIELARQSIRARLAAGDLNLGYFQPDALLTLVQPNYFGVLLGSSYRGPGDVTQHYFYAGIVLAPLAVVGLVLNARARRPALCLALPFVWYALGPSAGLYSAVSLLPGFHNVELPMHGWFLAALGLAVLGGAGLAALSKRFSSRLLPLVVVGVVFLDIFTFNSMQNRLAFSRVSAEDLFAASLRSLDAQIARSPTPVERLYGPPLTAVGYRNHALQSRVEATYGYNPLQLAAYADYQSAAEGNWRLVDGLAATHSVVLQADHTVTLEANPTALPRAYFPRALELVPDPATAAMQLPSLDPAAETVVVEPTPPIEVDPQAAVTITNRGDDFLVVRYRSATPNVLRLAIPRFPGWHATLNGQELPVLSVDYALLGVVVPPGEGEVLVSFAPRWFWVGAAISGVALALVVGALLLSKLIEIARGAPPERLKRRV